MKKNLMLAGLMMMSTIIFAQHHKGDKGANAIKRSEKMKTELSLNDDQYGKVKAINEKFAASHTKLRSDTSVTIGTARKRQEKLKTEHEAQIKSVLTDAQWTQWTARKSKGEDGRRQHKRHGRW